MNAMFDGLSSMYTTVWWTPPSARKIDAACGRLADSSSRGAVAV
jgi:hypothetical protein